MIQLKLYRKKELHLYIEKVGTSNMKVRRARGRTFVMGVNSDKPTLAYLLSAKLYFEECVEIKLQAGMTLNLFKMQVGYFLKRSPEYVQILIKVDDKVGSLIPSLDYT